VLRLLLTHWLRQLTKLYSEMEARLTMKCEFCGCTGFYYMRPYIKKIVTMRGEIEVKREVFKCKACHKSRQKDNGIAPRCMRIGWDVITEVLKVRNVGNSGREIVQHLKEAHDVHISIESVYRILKDFGDENG